MVERTNVPLVSGNTSDIKNKDSNYVFFFGVSSSGKTVILSAILYYLRTRAGALEPKLGTENTKSAKVLLHDLTEKIKLGIFPDRTTRDQVTRLDFEFIPNNRSKKVTPINLTFLEIAGGNHQDISKGNGYHSSIDDFIKADIPLNIIIVTSYDKAERDDTLIQEFFNELIYKGKKLKFVNVILVISKWDKSGRSEVLKEIELENFIERYLPMTNQHLDSYGLSKTYFTIGKVINTQNEEKIQELNLESAELLSNWLYESIVGVPLDYRGTFWERIKFSLFQ